VKKILFIYQPTQIYHDWVEKKLARNRVKFLSRIYNYFGFCSLAYYKSNPRTIGYCLDRALELTAGIFKEGAELYCIARAETLGDGYLDRFSGARAIPEKREFIETIRSQLAGMDKVVLLYPDAIGQGFEEIEAVVQGLEEVYVINGRKRVFRLTPGILKELRARRRLEKYFILEIITSLTLPFLFLPYCIYERVTRKSFRNSVGKDRRQRCGKSISERESDYDAGVGAIAWYWSSRPQTYGTEDGKAHYADEDGQVRLVEIGGKEFFERLDSTFYSWNRPLHTEVDGDFIPFGKIFDYKALYGQRVLEIGCGMGTMAMNWAKRGADLYAIDLNPVAMAQTKIRFRLNDLKGHLCLADARQLPFDDNKFRYVYSWGVLHHSPNIKRSVQEIYRVLEPRGKVGMMLYNRRSILFKYMVEYTEGFLHFENRFLSLVELASRYGDGGREEGNPYTYPLTRDEVFGDLMEGYKNVRVRVLGTDIDWMLSFLCIPHHRMIPLFVKKSMARRFGWSLWIEAEKA
jgi:SAM-dependent methyltransferase